MLFGFRFAEVLKRCAYVFLRNAERLMEVGGDLAMFNMEQYCRLILKYKLFVKKGSYPYTHSIRRLVRELGEINPRVLSLINDVKNLHYIARIEEAYITSRYVPYTYEEHEVRDIFRFVKEVFRLLVEEV